MAKSKAKTASNAKGKKSASPKPMRSKAEQIGVSDFTNLVRRCKSLRKQAQTTSGEMGEMIKAACENKNLDRVAFAIFRKLEAMPAQKLATSLACLDFYIEIGKLEDRIADEPALPIARQEAGEKEIGDKSSTEGRKTEEAAGATIN